MLWDAIVVAKGCRKVKSRLCLFLPHHIIEIDIVIDTLLVTNNFVELSDNQRFILDH